MKKIFVFLGAGFILVISFYLFNLVKPGSYIKEQEKRDILEQISQENAIMTTVKNDTRIELSQFGEKIINNANARQQELCLKQILNLLTSRRNCRLEELTIDNLLLISSIYEDGLSRVVNLQAEIEGKALMKMRLEEALSAIPSPQINRDLPKLAVDLPPVGKYCNGCYDAPPGGNPFVEENEVVNGQWVTGGYDTQTTDRKWSYIYYIFKGEFQGTYFKYAIDLPINESVKYGELEPKYSYKKIGEVINKDGLEIFTFQVTPTFDSDSIGRKDAVFTRDGNTYYIMFDWKDAGFDNTFDQIINSIRP